jgi:hypothetical protein
MSAHLPVTRQSLGRTFTVAAVMMGLIGAVQVGAIGWKVFEKKPEAVAEDGPRRPPEKIDIQRLLSEMPPPEEPSAPLAVVNDPLQGDPVAVGPTGIRPVPLATPLEPKATAETKVETTAPGTARPLIQPRPTPVPLTALTPKVSPQFTELIEQGKLLRNTGDTAGALVKFREASALEPTNAQAIAEQAYTYEKMSLHDKAAEQWKRVLSFGETGGVLYSAAKSKLDMAMSETLRVTSPVGPPRPIAEGKLIGLGTPMMRNDPDPASAKKFVLHVPITTRSGQKMNVKDMKVFVLFYDRLNANDLASTAANVSNRWADPPADWADGSTETLEVTYDLPPTEGRGERRDYYGYIVRLYYKDQLQDSYAEPAALNQRFPAAHTLSE